MSLIKKIFLGGFLLLILVSAVIWTCNFTIESATEDAVTSSISKLPHSKVGLLLGTSKTLASGRPNYYFKNRISAAVELYNSGKIDNIVVSGDNSVKGYNEPEDMKLELMKAGIPESKIFEDFAGFRTLDSVVRAKEIFGQKSMIIISQRFHNERAVFLAEKNGIDAYGYNAKDVSKYFGLKTKIREYFARVKVFVDLAFGVDPKFAGKKVIIP